MSICYQTCAMECVGGGTLNLYREQFDRCGRDFDLLFSTDTGDNDFYRKVIEAGHIYETGYPRCICWKSDNGPDTCECSRQALLYLYSQLLPHRNITVETIQTVQKGAESCIFRIILDES